MSNKLYRNFCENIEDKRQNSQVYTNSLSAKSLSHIFRSCIYLINKIHNYLQIFCIVICKTYIARFFTPIGLYITTILNEAEFGNIYV